jgi:phosphate transporter
MIGQERRGEIGDGGIKGVGIPAVSERKRALFRVHTRWGTFRVTKRIFFLTIALAVFFTLLNVKVLDRVEANNCLAILTFASILWATEVSPSPINPYSR